jgi:lipopolysaccharide export system ATP-binding protein
LLLDEPFAGIDPISLGEIKKLVSAITRFGIGVLVTDHNVRETLALVDRAYIIEGGRVMIQGTPSTIADDPDVRRSYLGPNFRL